MEEKLETPPQGEPQTATVDTKPATPATQAEPQKPIEKMSSDKIREMITKKEEAPVEPKVDQKVEQKVEAKEEWFDKERGFKTKEDALKSYSELQNVLREKSERQKQYERELSEIKEKANQRPLTNEEAERENSVKKWEEENKEAIDFLEQRIEKRLESKKIKETFEQEALKVRKDWKDGFDKDESRRGLWPTMEKIYAEKDVFRDFAQNPFPYIEAQAIMKEFPTIAEKIRAEAVESYKKSLKEAEEVERRSKTEVSGGGKSKTGDLDVNKLSSKEIESLLRREED